MYEWTKQGDNKQCTRVCDGCRFGCNSDGNCRWDPNRADKGLCYDGWYGKDESDASKGRCDKMCTLSAWRGSWAANYQYIHSGKCRCNEDGTRILEGGCTATEE